jgi:transcriptional regulator with XRE-family HTH domain
MNINTLLEQKSLTKYRLAKLSGVSQTTVIDICNGKTRIEKCPGDTLYKLAKALDVPMETLISDAMARRQGFETGNT